MADTPAVLVLVGVWDYEGDCVFGTVADVDEAQAWIDTPGNRLQYAGPDRIELRIVGTVHQPDLRVIARWREVPGRASEVRYERVKAEKGDDIPETPRP